MKKLNIMSISVILMTLSLLVFTSSTPLTHNRFLLLILEFVILLIQICYQFVNTRINTKLQLEKENYTTVLKHSRGSIWEYDIKTDTMRKSDKNSGLYFGSDYINNFSTHSIDYNLIYPDDLKIYNKFCHYLKTGKKEIRSMFRAKNVSGEYVWFEIIGTTLYKNNTPITVIGTTTDIDKQQKEYEKLKQDAEEDPLTKLYNRVTAEKKVNSIIENAKSGQMDAFCMIDIDNFKSLNDNLGHTFGDAVLIEFSTKLNNLLSANDFAFRIGGDEFAVFLSDIPSIDYAENMSKKICSLFKNLLLRESKPCEISGSIGISLYPIHGSNFDELFAMADIALYHSKDLGKDCYSLYSKKTMGQPAITPVKHNETTARDSHTLLDNSLLSKIIDVLFDAKDLAFTINYTLSLIGNYYNLDCIGVCEYTADNKHMVNTYYWKSQGSTDSMDDLYKVSIEDSDLFAYYKTTNTGVYYCRDINTLECDYHKFLEILKSQNIKSFIQCAIADSGNYTGYIYANIRKDTKQLEKHEIDTISFISKIIGGYIRKLRSEEKARIVARKDLLTDSYNINSFSEEAESILYENQYDQFAILNFDINKFKQINETLGYSKGDELLQQTAKMFKQTLTKNEIFGRIIGDRFLVLLQYDTLEDLENRIEYYFMQFNTLLATQSDCSNLSLIIGIYLIESNDRISIAVDRANIARKSIRERHKNNYTYFSSDMKANIVKRQNIENIMVDSLKKKEFCVYYQPKFNLTTGEIYGAEALIRWNHKNGIIYPNDFIPIFEENGFITEVDFFVLEEVCKQLRQLIDNQNKVVPISVNFSRIHFKENTLLQNLTTIIDKYKISPDLIEIEITESAMTDNCIYLIPLLEEIQKLGFRLSMDDFGSGLSSLNALRVLPFDILKLDKNFFRTETTTIKERIIISNIVNMARELKMEIISEGVETKEQAAFLKSIGCDYAQGYLFAKPMPANEYIRKYLL
jgi:diguanylate cyclase (GGDEF)-like protein